MKDYDEIADEWEEYRSKPSDTLLRYFLPEIEAGSVVLDAGCANGRNIPPIYEKAGFVIGLDSNEHLLKHARKRCEKFEKVSLIHASVTKIPLPDGHVDSIVCLAVLHHLSTDETREKAFKELCRVLKRGGKLFVTTWNLKQKKFESVVGKDALIGWKKKDGTTVKRFYHFFDENEFRELAEKTGFTVEKTFYDHKISHGQNSVGETVEGAANFCAVLSKK